MGKQAIIINRYPKFIDVQLRTKIHEKYKTCPFCGENARIVCAYTKHGRIKKFFFQRWFEKPKFWRRDKYRCYNRDCEAEWFTPWYPDDISNERMMEEL